MSQRVETPADAEEFIHWDTPAAARKRFEQQVQALLRISAQDFLRKLNAGEYADQLDDLAHPELMYLVSINPYRR